MDGDQRVHAAAVRLQKALHEIFLCPPLGVGPPGGHHQFARPGHARLTQHLPVVEQLGVRDVVPVVQQVAHQPLGGLHRIGEGSPAGLQMGLGQPGGDDPDQAVRVVDLPVRTAQRQERLAGHLHRCAGLAARGQRTKGVDRLRGLLPVRAGVGVLDVAVAGEGTSVEEAQDALAGGDGVLPGGGRAQFKAATQVTVVGELFPYEGEQFLAGAGLQPGVQQPGTRGGGRPLLLHAMGLPQYGQAQRHAVLAEVAVLPVRAVAPAGQPAGLVLGELDLVGVGPVHGRGDHRDPDVQPGHRGEIAEPPLKGARPGQSAQVFLGETQGMRHGIHSTGRARPTAGQRGPCSGRRRSPWSSRPVTPVERSMPAGPVQGPAAVVFDITTPCVPWDARRVAWHARAPHRGRGVGGGWVGAIQGLRS